MIYIFNESDTVEKFVERIQNEKTKRINEIIENAVDIILNYIIEQSSKSFFLYNNDGDCKYGANVLRNLLEQITPKNMPRIFDDNMYSKEEEILLNKLFSKISGTDDSEPIKYNIGLYRLTKLAVNLIAGYNGKIESFDSLITADNSRDATKQVEIVYDRIFPNSKFREYAHSRIEESNFDSPYLHQLFFKEGLIKHQNVLYTMETLIPTLIWDTFIVGEKNSFMYDVFYKLIFKASEDVVSVIEEYN